MFLGAGLGAYANGMFHLMTHAFFKALLFLAAGVVIHALAAEQDIRKMGGLRGLMPKTWLAMLIGGLALSGIPPFAGFFSKDSILAAALDAGWYGIVLWAAGLVGAFLTGLYTFRMIFLVFGGDRSPYVQEHFHPHGGREGPLAMMFPVAVLAVLSVVGGWLQLAGVWHPLTDFFEPVAESLAEATVTQELVTTVVAASLGLAGILVAWLVYSRRRVGIPSARPLRALFEHKFYFDEAYDLVFYRPAAAIARWFRGLVEVPLIGGSVLGVSGGTRDVGRLTTHLQTGLLRTYALLIAASVVVLAVVFVSVR
jgi:NADH-quinone oxidoreductase subunit L